MSSTIIKNKSALSAALFGCEYGCSLVRLDVDGAFERGQDEWAELLASTYLPSSYRRSSDATHRQSITTSITTSLWNFSDFRKVCIFIFSPLNRVGHIIIVSFAKNKNLIKIFKVFYKQLLNKLTVAVISVLWYYVYYGIFLI